MDKSMIKIKPTKAWLISWILIALVIYSIPLWTLGFCEWFFTFGLSHKLLSHWANICDKIEEWHE